jgi:hypothetical protein
MKYKTERELKVEHYLRPRGFAMKFHKRTVLPRGALRIGRLDRGYTFMLQEKEWLRNVAIFGPPRSGKSKTFLMNMLRDLGSNGSAIILDPSGELFDVTASAFQEVYRVDFKNPALSDRWNVLRKCKGNPGYANEMARIMVRNCIAQKVEEGEELLLKAILLHLAAIASEPTPSMISEYLALDHTGVRDLKEIETEMLNSGDGNVRRSWAAFAQAAGGRAERVAWSLMLRMDVFRREYARNICTRVSDEEREIRSFRGERVAKEIEFGHLRKAGTAIFLVVGEGDAREYQGVLNTFIGQAVQELRNVTDVENPAPVGLVLDDCGSIPIVTLNEVLAATREQKIGLILSYESLFQIQDQYGWEEASAILRSIGTMIFLPELDPITCEFASDRSAAQWEVARRWPHEIHEMIRYDEFLVAIDLLLPFEARYLPSCYLIAKKGSLVAIREKFARVLRAVRKGRAVLIRAAGITSSRRWRAYEASEEGV